MEATEHHHSGPHLDFNWGPYGAVGGESLQAVPQEMVPSAAPPSLPLFTDSQHHDGPQRTNSSQPELNVRSRPRRQTKGSKRYRNDEFVSDHAEDEEEPRQSNSGLVKRRSSSTDGTNTPSTSAAAATAAATSVSAEAAAAASAPPTQEVEDPGHAVGIPSTQVVPYHQQSQLTQNIQPESMHPNTGAELAYHHHDHHIPVSGSEQMVTAVQHEVMQQDPTMLQEVALQLDQELPVPVVPKLPPKQTEPLNSVAIQTLQSQDAASHDQYLKLLRFDDQVAELASRRGLLVRFVIKSVKTYQPQPEMIVEAPEFMTVEYLKRRIMKAKLLRGEFLNPMRFVMRKKGHNDSGEVVGMEDVPSREPTGDEIFLFHQGYEAPGPYELFIATAPQTTDREQQDRILGMTHQEAGNMDPRLSYQQLLQAPGMAGGGGQMTGMPGVSSTMQMGPNGELQQPHSAGLGMEMQGVLDGQQMSLHSGMLTNGMPVVPAMPVGIDGQQQLYALPHMENEPGPSAMTEKSPKPRRQTGRWMPEEVEALIEGVSLYKTSWAQIYERYVVTNKINSKRTQVDLKDKWRNLVKLVTDPNKHARGMDLSEEQRQTILRLVFANDVTTAEYGTTSADQAAAAAGGEGQLGGEAGLGDGQGLPVEAVPVQDISQADMAVLLQNMYAQYHQMGIPVPDAEVLQAQLQQHLQQQQFLQQHMSAEDVANMQVQAQQLQVLDQAMGLEHLGQMDPQQFAAYQQQIMAQQAQQHHMMSGDMQQYQQVDASGSYHEHYPQQLEEVPGAEHMHGHHHAQQQQQLDQQQGSALDMHAQHQHHPEALHPEAAAQLHAQQQQAHQQQHVVDPLQPLTEETLDLPPLTAQ